MIIREKQFVVLAWPDTINSITYLIKITEDMANATRLYGTLVEGKLNARKFYETNDVSYYTQEVLSQQNEKGNLRSCSFSFL